MRHVRVVNRSRGTVVASRAIVADSWGLRLRGYLARPEPGDGEGILLMPCNGIHTFGMRFPIDALFVGADGRVLKIVEGLRPWRRPVRARDARYVLEVPSGTADASRTEKGDALAWMGSRPGADDPTETEEPTAYGESRR
jgi:uncharacterized membrane protein (UPF0127 family)